MKRYSLYFFAFLLGILSATAQDKDSKKWDVSNPTGDWNFQEHSFTTDEGTWMNLDVSPDGKEIVFDLLGDIYKMPITGGKAELLRGGLPYEVQPRFSPDGEHISFTSDAGGGDNIWVMKNDGSEARQVTNEDFRLLNNAVWMPDGYYLVARKHFTSGRSLGAGEMWMYHITGGSGLQLTERKNDQQDVNEPSVSPDGKYLYYSEDMYPGGYFQYNKDPNSQIYVIQRYDFSDGSIRTVTGGAGGAARPQVSRDGKRLAFVRRVREKSVLFIRDLETGEEWPIYDQLSKDQQEAWAIFGVYPGFAWMPDNEDIVLWSEGKIKRISVASLAVEEIPFEVESTVQIAEALHFKNDAFQETFTAKAIRNAVTSPDGKTLLFNAAGYLWKKSLPNGKPERLTQGTDLEFEPSFSPDGQQVVYVTWNDENKGAIYRLNLNARNAQPQKITTEKGIYRTPVYSPDGQKIVYQKEDGNGHLGYTYAVDPGLYWMSANGGEAHFITEDGSYPSFSADNQRIYFQTGGYQFGNLTKELKSVTLAGDDEQTHVTSKYANRIIPSPDGQWIALIQLHKAYLMPMPPTGKTVDMDASSKAYPVAPITKDAGISVHWSADSETIHWTLGEQYFSNDVSTRFTFLPDSPDSVPAIDTVGTRIGLEVTSDKPEGRLALVGARIITMDDEEEVIENGTIIINENKIEQIGPSDEISVPSGVKQIDVSGKTIMPGIIDVHAHLGSFRYGISPQKHWQYQANLAFGVTTAHDPSANTEMVFSQSEMVKAGNMIGPRVFSTGIILYGADGDFKAVINSLDDARSAIRRTKAFGAFSVKSYNQPRREQRQQIITAAREEQMLVVPEGGSTFFHNMTMIMDGHTGIEHNIPVAPVYKDVIELWSHSKTGYTPTLIVNYAGMSGEYYFYQHDNVWENEKLLTFTPRSEIDSRARHRTMIPEAEYENGHVLTAEAIDTLASAGVKINLGAHGQIQGLGAHWELWMLQQGGMSNIQALRSATMNGAYYLGMDEQIGSLTEGKLADLIVLDENPLEDIRHTNSVRYTMINGRLYDANTLNEVGNYDLPRTKFFWELNNYDASFDWHGNSHMYGGVQCSCQTGH